MNTSTITPSWISTFLTLAIIWLLYRSLSLRRLFNTIKNKHGLKLIEGSELSSILDTLNIKSKSKYSTNDHISLKVDGSVIHLVKGYKTGIKGHWMAPSMAIIQGYFAVCTTEGQKAIFENFPEIFRVELRSSNYNLAIISNMRKLLKIVDKY